MSIIILDLDNTIANDGWRIPMIDWASEDPFNRYHKYHSLSAFDEACNKDLFEGVDQRIVVFTARPVNYRYQTEEWLKRVGVKFDALYMRNTNDHRSSALLKVTQFGWLTADYGVRPEDVHCLYDDREDVVSRFRAMGVIAERRWIHDICAYTNPNAKEKA